VGHHIGAVAQLPARRSRSDARCFQSPAEEEILIDRMSNVGTSHQFSSIGDAPIIRTLIF